MLWVRFSQYTHHFRSFLKDGAVGSFCVFTMFDKSFHYPIDLALALDFVLFLAVGRQFCYIPQRALLISAASIFSRTLSRSRKLIIRFGANFTGD